MRKQSAPIPTLRVRLFGRPRIDVEGERIESRLSAQGLLLFAMLVTQHERWNRDDPPALKR